MDLSQDFRRAGRSLLAVLVFFAFSRPTVCSGGVLRTPVVAVVVDDLGFSAEAARRLSSIPIPLTWAIIPYQRFSAETAMMAGEKGIPFILHIPMEAKRYVGDKNALVRVGMPPDLIRMSVRNAFWSLPGAVGVNNHQGSHATEDLRAMEAVMKELAAEGVFFLDSRTSGSSIAYSVALEKDVPAARNQVFLDHYDEGGFIWSQFEKAFAIARRDGGVIAICHARPGTLDFLPRLYEIAPEDIKFVTVPEYLEHKRIGSWEE
jgi:hypothetical protein